MTRAARKPEIAVHGATTPRAPFSVESGTFAKVDVRRVLARPHPVLAQRSREVDPRSPEVVSLANALVTTMRASPACVGLAAPQVGEPVRVFCLDVSGHKKTRSCAGLVVLVNPAIVSTQGLVTMREGCMSVPHLTGDVTRARDIVLEGYEPGTARFVRLVADGFEARCAQHEIDHLDGFTFVDRVCDPSRHLHARKTYA